MQPEEKTDAAGERGVVDFFLPAPADRPVADTHGAGLVRSVSGSRSISGAGRRADHAAIKITASAAASVSHACR